MKFYSLDEEKIFNSKIASEYHSVDVIGAKLGGKVLSFSDEWFAAAENLILPKAPVRDATKYTPAGAWYDGWETRRHNENPYDWVILRMGVFSAQIVGGEIDTAFFNGNQAEFASVEGLYDEAATDISETDERWDQIIPKFECEPSKRHFFLRTDGLTEKKYTHIKLKMFPDGGIARFRLYGKVFPPNVVSATKQHPLDLASACNGGVALAVSDQHFGSADNLLVPGRGHDMSDGWETTRSRKPGHVDWVIIQLGRETSFLDKVIIDTAHFKGNFPQYIMVHGAQGPQDDNWIELVPKSKTGPDKEHEYVIGKEQKITHVKVTIIPDGGLKRIRVWGY
ncbi:hypothetical protein HG535_0E01560 [Zygotorulaspora mrakii]|uniref:allantoicase n=1 Tax=Zygotorulaspora mrakii TaxID=42260 RepID=A0A7H9B5N1_ZYGMR|nr:uncharacterized protein HG535_0E01560 [Zygotorulaspora mrakii]QLG73072.1 hypothetical protein HG535_0E01560 [Zygotorulaspora mrakii]